MTLPKKEAKLFFELFIPLLGYANQYDGKGKRRQLDKARKILYDNPQIIKDFVVNNPENFNQEKIEIVSKWQNFIKGDFLFGMDWSIINRL